MLAAASNGGSSSSSKTRIYALDADKDKYLSLARDNLGYANEMLLISARSQISSTSATY